MDPNNPPHSSDGLYLRPAPARYGDGSGIGNGNGRRSVSPVSPRAAPANPATPSAVDEPEAHSYFDSVDLENVPSVAASVAPSVAPSDAPSATPSTRSRFSRFSFSFPSTSRVQSVDSPLAERSRERERPALSGNRQPSIRIRRSSYGSRAPDAAVQSYFPPSASGGLFPPHDRVDDGRLRSISQPERAQLPEGSGLAQHSRRVPSMAMPRLTEEGVRPSAAELGLSSTSPLSPTLSLPEPSAGGVHDLPGYEDQPVPQRRGLQTARKMSRMFWPGHKGRQGEKQAVPPQTAAEAEYESQLVDWLDTIGMSLSHNYRLTCDTNKA